MTLTNEYFHWEKGEFNQLSPFFVSTEFECHCSFPSCKQQLISIELLDKLQEIRITLDGPVIIKSGYRCSEYQAQLAKAGYETAIGISQHQLGNAADITSKKLYSLGYEIKQRFKAIGTASDWFHVDTRSDKLRTWFYKRS